jgi:hypothetical protein
LRCRRSQSARGVALVARSAVGTGALLLILFFMSALWLGARAIRRRARAIERERDPAGHHTYAATAH